MFKKTIYSVAIILFLLLAIRFALGIYAYNQLESDDGNEVIEYSNITIDFRVIIADEVKTYTYGSEVTGVFEKDASVYYYDGKVTINNDKSFRRFIMKDFGSLIVKQIIWPEDVVFLIYETLPRFYDDVNKPDKSMLEAVERPLIVYELNAFNMITDKYYIDKDIEYERIKTYIRK